MAKTAVADLAAPSTSTAPAVAPVTLKNGEPEYQALATILAYTWTGIPVYKKDAAVRLPRTGLVAPGIGIDSKVAACGCGWMSEKHSEVFKVRWANHAIAEHGLTQEEADLAWDAAPIVVKYDEKGNGTPEDGGVLLAYAPARGKKAPLPTALLKKMGQHLMSGVSANAPKAAVKKVVTPADKPATKATKTAPAKIATKKVAAVKKVVAKKATKAVGGK